MSGCVALAEAPAESTWRVWLEPKFMRAPVAHAVAGAERTEFAAGFRENGETFHLLKPQFEALHLGWDQFFTKARRNANAELAPLSPRYARDKRQIILYAELRAKEPVVASAVLAPTFLDLFKETLGETLLVVVPSRYAAFVFPRLASDYQQYAPMIFTAYRETPYPVSVELFEVSTAGWRAVGAYQEP